ncbi:MAG: type II secretion system protein [Candidatus Portnoybacteria bacterium]|nr:type II secretion system protein [Candidatus Portnoybacteria bacterium]
MRKKRGFTLIELLVVIAIIGILATIVLVSLNSARVKARDARRQSDMHQIALAMEMYYDSQSPASYLNIADTATAIPVSSSIGTYMNPVPLDPTNSGNYIYYWADNGTPTTTYCVWGRLEAITTATYVLSNSKGTKQTTTAPTEANCAGL